MNVQAVLLMAGLAIAAATLYGVRREHVRAEYSVGWLATGVILAAAGFIPGGIATGFGGPELALTQLCLLLFAGVLLAGLVFWTTRLVSRLWDERVILAQRAAILEFRMRRDNQQHGVQGE